jgi:cysteine desulfurase
MHVQNETGAVFPVEAIARQARARARKVLVHSDGVQAFGKVPSPSSAVDLYTISAHKVHGPKGVGALRVAKGARILPLLHGGGHEHGLRSGTEALPAIVGLGRAAELAVAARAAFAAEARRQGSSLRAGLEALGAVINSPPSGVPSTVNASFPGLAAEPLLHALEARDVYVSTRAACASRKNDEGSLVLRAMGLPEDRTRSALRFSLSRETTQADVDAALAAVQEALQELATC